MLMAITQYTGNQC